MFYLFNRIWLHYFYLTHDLIHMHQNSYPYFITAIKHGYRYFISLVKFKNSVIIIIGRWLTSYEQFNTSQTYVLIE